MDPKIRQLSDTDWPHFKVIRLECLKLHPEAFGTSYEEVIAWSDEEWQQVVTNNDIFVGNTEGEVIGVAGFFIYGHKKFQHRGCLFGLYVRSGFRGQGVANQLVQKIITYANTKVIQLHCTVMVNNVAAIELYKKFGFQIYGTEPRSLKVGDKFYDEHLMVLRFN